MIDRTGILKHSPLAYSLASVRFASWPLLAKKIDEIHNELREILPLIHAVQVQSIGLDRQAIPQFESATPNNIWMLTSIDRSYGIQLTPDQLLVYSSKYLQYRDFENVIDKVLTELLKHMRFMDVLNAGVRYVDRIGIREGEDFKDYLAPSLLPADIPGLGKIGGEVFGVYRSGDAELRVRCINQPNVLNVPVDMLGIISLVSGPSSPPKLELLKSNELLLDMDAVKSFSEATRMDAREILKLLDSLHKEANAFFRHDSVCTEHAFRVWKGEQS